MGKKKIKNKNKNKDKTIPAVSEALMTRDIFFALVFLSVSIFAAYSVALKGTWALDDTIINRTVTISDLSEMLGFRKVAYLTFLINQKFGGFSAVSYRLFNIFIHVINSILVFALAFQTLKDRQTTGNAAYALSLIAATVFALHPVNINAVSYIVQRMASLSAMFVLLALLSYRHAILSGNRGRKISLYVLSSACIIFGIFSKENAILAIPLILLYDRYFLLPLSGNGKLFSRRMAALLVICGVSLVLAAVFLRLGRVAGDLSEIVFRHFNEPLQARGWMARDVYWSPLEHLLTEFRVVGRYLFLIIVPWPGFFVFDWWGYPLSESLTNPPATLPAMLLLLCLLVFGFLSRKRYPFLSFGIFWYLIAVSLESFIAIGSDLYFEHRNYLPVAGLFFGIAAQAGAVLTASPSRVKVWAAVCIMAVLLGGATFARNRVFADSVSLWSDTVNKAPENLRATVALGNAYLKKSNFSEAENHYRRVIEEGYRHKRAGFFIDAAYSLGMIHLFQSQTDKARSVIDFIEDASEGSYEIEVLKAFYLAKTGKSDEAAEMLQKLLGRGNDHHKTRIYTILGDIFKEKQDLPGAEEHYRKALAIDPMFSAAYYGLATVRLMQRDPGHAEEFLRKARDIDPDNVLVLSDLSDIQLLKKNADAALKFAREAVSLDSDFPNPYVSMGNALIYVGQYDDADRYYREAEQRGFSETMAIFSKARALLLRGDLKSARNHLEELLRRKDTPPSMRSIIDQEIGKL